VSNYCERCKSIHGKMELCKTTAEILGFEKEKVMDFPEQQEAYDRIIKIIHEYDDVISVAAAVGVLELVKDSIINHLRE